VGDPIEVGALTQAFRESTEAVGSCWIGSSKTNIGHTDTAAGVAALIQVVEALRHRQIPPSLHYERPNPNIDFEHGPFRVNAELRDWEARGGPRRAGVNSLGVGGTNAFAIVEEAPAREPSGPASRELELLVTSARNGRALDNTTAKLAAHLREHPDLDLADAAHTLQVGREAFEHRRVVVAGSPADAADALEAMDPKRVFTARAAETPPQIDFMFPGGGAQYPNMGLELYAREKVYRDALDECLELAAPQLPFDLRRLMMPGDGFGDDVVERLTEMAASLPAIFATEIALARLWMSWGVEPRAMTGHSMGEYVAACLSGVFSLADAIRIVCLRGVLMDRVEADCGMLSVSLPASELVERLGGECELAAENAPSLCTVSGTTEQIEALAAKLRDENVESRPLRISTAAHSRLLDPFLDEFGAALREIRLSPPERPYISNLTGDWVRAEDAVDPDYWVRHLRQPVRWSGGLERLLAEGSHLLLEVGPGQILGSLARQQQKRKAVAAISSLRHPDDDVSDLRFMMTAFGRLWSHGADVRFDRLRGEERRNRIALPTYGFDRQAYWIEPDPVATGGEAEPLERAEDLDDWFFRPAWRPAPPPPPDEAPCRRLVFADDQGVAAALIARLEARGHTVVTVREGDAFYELGESEYAVSPEAGLEGYVALVQALAARDRLPDRIAHCWLVTGDDAMAWDGSNFFHYAEERGFYSLLHLAQAFGAEDVTHPIHVGVVSNGLQRVGDEPLAHPEKATAFGPIRVIPQEFRNLTCQSVDLPKPPPSPWWRRAAPPDLGAHADWLASDLHPDLADGSLAYRGDGRFVQEIEAVRSDALPELESRLRDGGTYLITGGLGGLGLMLAEHLARTRKANLVLVSRGDLPPRGEWRDWIDTHAESDPTAARLRALLAIEAAGGQAMVAPADVSNVVRMREIAAEARERFGRIDGVFHAAGVIDDGPIQTKSQPEIERVFTPKVHGTLVLDELVSELEPDVFVLFSSNSAWLGTAGQVDYTGASAWLNALAESRAAAGGPTYTVAVDWGVWRGVGGAVETYRRLRGAERAGPPVAHPLLDRRAPADGAGEAFTSELAVADRWVLDEHRTADGSALLPGTGYLELAYGAFATTHDGPSEIRSATFVSPLAVSDDAPVELRLTLRPDGDGDGHEFEVASRVAGGEEWTLHAQGEVAPCAAERPGPLPIAEVEARCARVEDAGAGDGLRTLHEGQLRFGPRWRSIRRMQFGEGEALARLALPDDFRRDLDEWALHPALLDMATGFATPLIRGYRGDELFAPMGYGRVRVFERLPAELVSHVRSAADNDVARETASFHVTLADADGRVCVEIEDFTLRKLSGSARLGERAAGRDRRGAASGPGPGHELSEAERVFQHTYELGITPEEGVAALERVLAGGTLPEVSVSPIHLPTLIERMRSLPSSEAGGATRFARPELETDYVAPRDEVERTLVDIWRELLGVEEVGIRDDFFELGGHSLIAVRVFAKIKKLWGVEYPISLLFDAPNVERIAETIRADAGLEVGEAPAPRSLEPRFRCLVPLQKAESDRPPFFLVAGMFGNVLNLRHVATHLSADQPMWAIQARGLLGDDPPHETFEEAARDYLEEVRAVQPEGPYYLGGFSGGGITAFEMSRQLREAGEEVGLLVLLDSIPAELPPLSWRDRLTVQWHRLRTQGPRYLGRWLVNRVRWEFEKREKRAEADGPRDLSPAEFRSGLIEQAFRRSLSRYRTGVHDGPITLIRPSQDHLVPLAGGRFMLPSREIVDYENLWGPHTTQGVRVEIVPGDHDSMVLEPNVRVLAARLQACLDEAMLGQGEDPERRARRVER
jgi:acyl transferase domain-containing protein